ncbi:hypothetical protein GCM10023148_33500 [Actinokineospora soli]
MASDFWCQDEIRSLHGAAEAALRAGSVRDVPAAALVALAELAVRRDH